MLCVRGGRVDVHMCEGGGEWMSMCVRGEESVDVGEKCVVGGA